MNNKYLFEFKAETSGITIPEKLNNPFSSVVSEIAKIAAIELQEFIALDSQIWEHDFSTHKGKMFGVLVVQKADNSFGYLGAVSGKIPEKATSGKFVPSIFNDSTDDFFINRGMSELTEIGNLMKESNNQSEINSLVGKRKRKSLMLQHKLFENYRFLNLLGEEQNVLQIFENSSHGYPPSATGECAAPKLLQFAFNHNLKPIALTEFWWGNPPKNNEKIHKHFYSACKNKCRPVLEYMLNDTNLFDKVN
jgi:tRNA pseudouridine32 synthase/23S rRNA pseudouridine746 synthase